MIILLEKAHTWYEIINNRIAVGIVFMTKTSSTDQAHGWKHGYVLGLHEGTKGLAWSSTNSLYNKGITQSWDGMASDLDGYSRCQNIVKRSDYSASKFPAIFDAMNYKAKAEHFNEMTIMPDGCYWMKADCNTMTVRDNLNSYLKPLVGAGYKEGTSINYFKATTYAEDKANAFDPYMITSTEVDANYIVTVLFGCSIPDAGPDFDLLWLRYKKTDYDSAKGTIRCGLAF